MSKLEQCPWRTNRFSPRKEEMELLVDYMLAQSNPPSSLLEIGCGASSWYLNQLNFKDYTAVETYEPAIDNVKKNIPNINVITRWTDIPKIEYQYIVIDSHVGGTTMKETGREEPLKYIMENKLYNENSTLIVHDYCKVKKFRGDTTSRNGKRFMGWNSTVDYYKWEVVGEVEYKKSFGIYSLKPS